MKKLIYIVEDEPDLKDALVYNFQNDFKVESFGNGETCLEKIKKKIPDLIVLDIMLPGMSGLDLCKKIRASEELSNIAIILLTAKGEEIDRIVGFEIGADDYVTKPFSVRELILRAKVILKKSTSDVEEKLLEYASISMNLSAHKVTANGAEILLTALEFKLLKHLLKRKGRVQSRDQLLSDVWKLSTEVTTRTVDTHIKRLREKLGKSGDLIQTIRGVGYRFNNLN
ncbi:MAG: response regulator [Gammaproteobacteria bacterium]|tara:strand:- start:581 stop:1261 length:681 start_codon:yes stop_codon:yes gene_type:complete